MQPPPGYERLDGTKLDRTCPRCNGDHYHFANRYTNGQRFFVIINCANCGHDWKGRYRHDEWN